MPKDEMMDDELYSDELGDDEMYIDDEDDGEAEPQPKKAKAKGKVRPGVLALGGVALVVGLGGALYVSSPETLSEFVPADLVGSITAMLPGGEGGDAPSDEPAPEAPSEPAEAPTEAAEAPPVPKPVVKKPQAAKVAAGEAEAEPKPAAKPLPKAKAARVAASAGTGRSAVATQAQLRTGVRFQAGSAFLAASEIEQLWTFSNQLKGNTGKLRVQGNVDGSGAEIAQRRADRVAEVLRKNTSFRSVQVDVTRGAGAPVEVTFTNAL